MPEFVQVKNDNLDQLWSISKLCEECKVNGSKTGERSLLQKQLDRDRGDELPRFRIVTSRDVKKELSILRQPREQRSEEDTLTLKASILENLGEIISPKNRGVEYWLENVLWDCVESIESIESKNLRLLEEILNCLHPIPLFLYQKQNVYSQIIARIRDASGRRWSEGSTEKRISRDSLLEWLNAHLEALPKALGPTPTSELVYLERESLARCEARLRALSFSEEEAGSLVRDTAIGALNKDVASLLHEKFSILNGEFGAGKSLQMERLFQKELFDYQYSNDGPIPVFIEGKRLIGKILRDEVTLQSCKLGDVDRQGAHIIIDGIDEAGLDHCIDLLNQAYALSKTFDKSSVIVTTTNLPGGLYQDNLSELPLLTQEEALKITSRIAGFELSHLGWINQAFWNDLPKPLFSILLGLHLRQGNLRVATTADIISSVVNQALQSQTKKFYVAQDLLAKLAMRLVNAGGEPIFVDRCGLNKLEIQALAETRLIVEDGGRISFSVALFMHWFAARALQMKIIEIADIVSSAQRINWWHYPLCIFLSTQSFDDTFLCFSFLVSNYPAFASVIVHDTLRNGWHSSDYSRVRCEEVAPQILKAMDSWKEGVGTKLATLTLPTDTEGNLLKVKAAFDGHHFYLAFYQNPEEKEVKIYQSHDDLYASIEDDHGVTFSIMPPSNQSAWPWRLAVDYIQENLATLLAYKSLPIVRFNGALAKEVIWKTACDLMAVSVRREISIPLEELEHRLNRFQSGGISDLLHRKIRQLRENGSASLEAPFPQADLDSFHGHKIWSAFSSERIILRANAVFENALESYKELVEEWFPHFLDRLPFISAMPLLIRGGISPDDNEKPAGVWPLIYWTYLLDKTKSNQVRFELRRNQSFQDWKESKSWEELCKMRPLCSDWALLSRGSGMGLESVCYDDAASRIAYDWLKTDLKAIGLLRN